MCPNIRCDKMKKRDMGSKQAPLNRRNENK